MDKIYVKGIMTFPPHANAPDFVKGTAIITLEDLTAFFHQQKEHHTEYGGKAQLKCQILEGDKGLYFTVDTWKAEGQSQSQSPEEPELGEEDDIGF